MKRISLRTKLIVHSTLLVLGAVVGVGVSLYLAERLYLLKRFEHTQLENVQSLVQIAREAITTRNQQLLESYLSLLRRSRALTYAMVHTGDGTVIAHTNDRQNGARLADPMTAKAVATQEKLLRQEGKIADDIVVDLTLPILKDQRRLALARVGYSKNFMAQLVDQALEAARERVILAAAVALAVGVFIAILLSFLLSRPIRHLRDGAHRIGDGNLDHRIRITSRDELGELAGEFNTMAAKLQELDQLKQDFVSNVTHELRSPLTSLRGYVEFLLRGSAGPLNEEQKEYLIVVKNNALRLARFIDNLLDVAKIEAGKLELHREPVSIADLAKEMQIVFRPMGQEKKVAFSTDIPADLPPVLADPDKLSEVFTNLLSNAYKFTEESGRIELTATRENEFVHLVFNDTGTGIPPEALETVFNKFEQVKPTRGLARKTKGTGLGLSIVKGFVEAHGGRVWMESAPGRGTTAHVLWPVADPAALSEEEIA
ncbi:MAG: HAMP domain-containing protein [Elusimicrobia bacterium]|nr:MAG: HAMP domain-containing protein [Elusimicrobiota bacterium]